MAKDKNKHDEYPKQSENDKRWKQQDEFDSPGPQHQREDQDKNASIPQSRASASKDEANNRDTYSSESQEKSGIERKKP